MNLTGASYKQDVTAKSFTQSRTEAEFCTCNGCEYIEYAFHDSGTDEWKKDKSSFLVRRNIPAETWVFKLLKNGVTVATVTDSTYGEYYNFGSLLYSDLKGIVIYWTNVYNAFGNGNYTVRIIRTFYTEETIIDSHIYKVIPYSFDIANGTVRIESVQNGTFIGTGWTYRGLKWPQWIRTNGKFWQKTPTLEVQEYLDSDRQRKQVWDKIVNEYTLELQLLPSFIANEVLYNQILANDLYITDYNINFEVYRAYPVRIKSISSSKYYHKNTNGTFSIKLTDRAEGTIKGY